MTNSLVEQAAAAVKNAKVADQTADNGGSFEYTPPAEGTCAARLVGYIELGKRPQKPYQGQEKPDALEAFVIFQLFGKKHAIKVGEGDDAKTVYPLLRERVQVKSGDRANFVKLLKKMSYGRDITHMALMLGEAFKLKIVHNKSEDGKKTYANIRTKADGYMVEAPMYNANTDPMGEEDMQPLPVPEPTVPLQLLLWDNPTVEQWQSIFIDGTRTTKDDDGNEVTVSKNWMQNDIIENATDFEGSDLQALITKHEGVDFSGGAPLDKESTDKAAQDDLDGPDLLDDGDAGDDTPQDDEGHEEGAQDGSDGSEDGEDDDDPLAGLDLG